MYFGSTDPLNREHLRKLKRLIRRTRTPWLSDHLCWGSVDGTYTHDLLPMPYTMAAARRTEKPLHPTNLHVNKDLFPNDTVQSRLPDPEWLEHWLDEQIRFDASWEQRVVDRILHSLSVLLGQRFTSAQELNRYRKSLGGRAGAVDQGQAPPSAHAGAPS